MGVDGGDLPYAQPFADNDQGCIGEVHRQVRVLLDQFGDAEEVIGNQFYQGDSPFADPADEIDLSRDAEVQEIGDFGEHRGSGYQFARECFQEIQGLLMILVSLVK